MKKLLGPGRLPKPENLGKLTPDQLRDVLHRFGIDATEIRNQMLREMSKPASQIAALRRQGLEIDDAMIGRLRDQIRRTNSTLIRRMTDRSISEYRQESMKMQNEKLLNKKIWVWACKFKNSCESCIRRHAVVKSYTEWERLGLPKSDALVCGSNCHCEVFPKEGIDFKELEQSPDDLESLRTRQRGKREADEISEQLRFVETEEIE